MLIEAPDKYEQPLTLQLLPMPLKQYGVNLYGEPLFRIVWSESRTYMVGAVHVDHYGDPATDRELKSAGRDNVVRRDAGYRYYPLYPAAKCWVLEIWKSPIAYCGLSPQGYYDQYFDPASGLLTLGPYPDRGEYMESFRFPGHEMPPSSSVARVINAIKAGWNYNFTEHKQAIEKDQEAKKKAADNRADAIFLDSQQAFKNRPSSLRPGKRTKDHIRFNRTAAETGIHQRGFSTSGR